MTDEIKFRGKKQTGKSHSKSNTQKEFHGISKEKIFSRIVLASVIMALVYLTSRKNDSELSVFARQVDTIPRKAMEVPCSTPQGSSKQFSGCSPKKCARLVFDNIVNDEEVKKLIKIARKGLEFGRSDGGASILDLHSGALSKGRNFINVYKAHSKSVFTTEDFLVYKTVKNKIKKRLAEEFGLMYSKLYLTHPTFFSEITSNPAQTGHDEYWHPHVDKDQYKLFHYTSLLYLTDYNIDFQGGRFVFLDSRNITIEPKAGRVSMFTSGHENPHFVEKVTGGVRYAITIPFTCDENFAISDPEAK